ncbi:MAG: tetratricopeptide repeat protein [Candidatus Omnitrophota bacterium]
MNQKQFQLKIGKIVRLAFFLVVVFGLPVFSVSVHAQSAEFKRVFTNALKAYEQSDFTEAQQLLEQAIDMSTNFAPPYYFLGTIYRDVKGDPESAVWFFETAAEINPDYAEAHDGLCRAYYQLLDYDRAETACLRALELNPDLGSSQLTLAWTYLIGKSEEQQAIHYFNKVVEQVDHPIVYFGLGMAYAIEGDHSQVLDIVTRLKALGKQDLAAHLEAVLRSKVAGEELIPVALLRQMGRPPERAEGRLVGEHSEKQPKEPGQPPADVDPRTQGKTQIRIQGKIPVPQITGMQGVSQPRTYGGQSGKTHPGSLTPE